VNISEQYNHGIRAPLDMIVFLLLLMKQLKECDPLMLPGFASFSPSHMLIHTTLVLWYIGSHVLEIIQIKTLVYG